MGRKRLSEEQRLINKQYQAERDRIKKQINRLKRQGIMVDFELPPIPETKTKIDVVTLKEIGGNDVINKSTVEVKNEEGFDIIPLRDYRKDKHKKHKIKEPKEPKEKKSKKSDDPKEKKPRKTRSDKGKKRGPRKNEAKETEPKETKKKRKGKDKSRKDIPKTEDYIPGDIPEDIPKMEDIISDEFRSIVEQTKEKFYGAMPKTSSQEIFRRKMIGRGDDVMEAIDDHMSKFEEADEESKKKMLERLSMEAERLRGYLIEGLEKYNKESSIKEFISFYKTISYVTSGKYPNSNDIKNIEDDLSEYDDIDDI